MKNVILLTLILFCVSLAGTALPAEGHLIIVTSPKDDRPDELSLNQCIALDENDCLTIDIIFSNQAVYKELLACAENMGKTVNLDLSINGELAESTSPDEASNFKFELCNLQSGVPLNLSFSLKIDKKSIVDFRETCGIDSLAFQKFQEDYNQDLSTAIIICHEVVTTPPTKPKTQFRNNVTALEYQKVVPNPASDFIEIRSNIEDSGISFEVYNHFGQLLIRSNEKQIDISLLHEGLYLVKSIWKNQSSVSTFYKSN